MKLANYLETRAIAEDHIKTDRRTARILAYLLRVDLIPECYVPPRKVQDRRNLLRHRSALIKARTKIRNQVQNILDKHGLQCEYGDIFCKRGMRWLEGPELLGEDQNILESHLRRLRGLEKEVEEVKARIALKASEDEDVKLLMTLTGVSHFGSQLLVSEIGDITRFPSARKLVSWAGLCTSRARETSLRYTRGKTWFLINSLIEPTPSISIWMMGQAL